MNEEINKIPEEAEKELKEMFNIMFVNDIIDNNNEVKEDMNKNVEKYSDKLTEAYKDFKDCIDDFKKIINDSDTTEKFNTIEIQILKANEIIDEIRKNVLSNSEFNRISEIIITEFKSTANNGYIEEIKNKVLTNSEFTQKSENIIAEIKSIANNGYIEKIQNITSQNVELFKSLTEINNKNNLYLKIIMISNLIIVLSIIFFLFLK